MIVVITISVVLIVLGIMTIIQNRKRNTRIKELEQRLDRYYKERTKIKE